MEDFSRCCQVEGMSKVHQTQGCSLSISLLVQDTICDVYLRRIPSEGHDLFEKRKASRDMVGSMWFPTARANLDDDEVLTIYTIENVDEF